ncbi:uncharacterized protein TNCV_347101 [Trichonephila clavipes]|nr:uncharacterized protein TNCV_347101 [Trichonephila clavipes]
MPRIKKFGRRKYSSNQHKKSKSTEELLLNSVESASRRKIKIPDLLQEQDSQNVNIIVELDLLSSLMKNLLCCKYCCSSEKIELREDLKSRRGLAVSLEIICHNSGESTSTMSSKISNKCYDVNLRLTYGMRAIGKGGAAARIFCGLMNLPPPPAKFERHNSLFLNVLKTISEDSMNAAVHEAVIANDNNSNIAVAVDGTWHKRGYSSLNGVVCATSVENGKVIDFEALTKYCSSCKVGITFQDGDRFNSCRVIYSQFGLAIHHNDHQARRRFVEWAQNEIAVVPDFHKRILFSDEAHFWLNGYVNKQNCCIWSEANPQVYVETPLHPEKLTVWCALWAGGIIGPYFFKNDEVHNVTVNGDRYRGMITNFFIPELNNHDVQELWFQQDGATCPTARATIDLLKDTFGDCLISHFGPVN